MGDSSQRENHRACPPAVRGENTWTLRTKRQGQEVVLDEELSERLKALGYIN